jgi:ABC-type transport system substrate-binding protein
MRRAAVFIGVMIAAVACPGPSHPTPTSAPSAERGGTLRVGVTTSQGRDYDPQVYSGTWMFDELGRCCLLRTLLSYNGQDTLHGGTSLHPDLATALPEISTDDLTWTFRLKTGIHYAPPLQHTEIVAEDFIRAIAREIAPAPPYVGFFSGLMGDSGGTEAFTTFIQGAKAYSEGKASSISGLAAPNHHTLVVHLTEPYGDVGYQFATPVTAPIPPNPNDPAARFGVAEGHDGDYGKLPGGLRPVHDRGKRQARFPSAADQPTPGCGHPARIHDAGQKPFMDPCHRPSAPGIGQPDRHYPG